MRFWLYLWLLFILPLYLFIGVLVYNLLTIFVFPKKAWARSGYLNHTTPRAASLYTGIRIRISNRLKLNPLSWKWWKRMVGFYLRIRKVDYRPFALFATTDFGRLLYTFSLIYCFSFLLIYLFSYFDLFLSTPWKSPHHSPQFNYIVMGSKLLYFDIHISPTFYGQANRFYGDLQLYRGRGFVNLFYTTPFELPFGTLLWIGMVFCFPANYATLGHIKNFYKLSNTRRWELMGLDLKMERVISLNHMIHKTGLITLYFGVLPHTLLLLLNLYLPGLVPLLL